MKQLLKVIVLLLTYFYTQQYCIAEEANKESAWTPPCNEMPILLDRCLPSICLVKSAAGDIYRYIKGYQEGACVYQEHAKGYSDINCKFPEQELVAIAELFNKRFASLESSETKLTEQETKRVDELIDQYCEISETDETTPVEFNPLPNSSGDNQGAAQQVSNVEQKNANLETKSKFHSIMFDSQEMDIISHIIDNDKFFKNKVDKFINRPEPALEFYLNSILYMGADRWSIWLDGNKYNQARINSNLEVLEIVPEYIKLRLTGYDLNKVSQHWQYLTKSLDSKNYKTPSHEIYITKELTNNFTVDFTLKPNQTFSLKKLEITEGYKN